MFAFCAAFCKHIYRQNLSVMLTCDYIKIMSTITVLIADDHPVYREGVRRLLEEDKDLQLIGEVNDGEEAVRLTIQLEPHVVVMDIIMPKLNGIEAAKQIKAVLPRTAILMLSAYNYEAYVLNAVRAGVAGFLHKGVRGSELLAAIKTVQAGEPILDPTLAYKVLAHLVSTSDSSHRVPLAYLHNRELDVLQLAAKGMTNKEIAQELIISERTVQTHFANIFRKLNVGSRTEALLHALKEGWLSLEDLAIEGEK